MTKGIRAFTNATFMSELGTRAEVGNTQFRQNVIGLVVAAFEISVASAATHYNHAFKTAREAAKTNPELATQLEGLGRPEGKKGGRKPKVKAEATAEGAAETTAGTETAATATEPTADAGEQPAAAEGEPATA